MLNSTVSYSLFTKHWRSLSVWELGKKVSNWGFDGIEFPLREGYQLEPGNAEQLPRLVQQFADHGLRIFSIASTLEERIFAACAEAGIPIIRIMPDIIIQEGYESSLERNRRALEQALPLCEKYNVKVGCQQHHGNHFVDAAGLSHLLQPFDPRCIGAIWDAAHDALAGQQPEIGLDIVWRHLCMINLKNAVYERITGSDAPRPDYQPYFTSGEQGMASWQRAAAHVKKRGYRGVVCLSAQYNAEAETDRLIAQDIAFAKTLFS